MSNDTSWMPSDHDAHGKPERTVPRYNCKICGNIDKTNPAECYTEHARDICPHWLERTKKETVVHPAHYGGDTVYETIKVIDAWGLNFCLGNAVKYISRAGKKESLLEDLKKSRWYLDHEISKLENTK